MSSLIFHRVVSLNLGKTCIAAIANLDLFNHQVTEIYLLHLATVQASILTDLGIKVQLLY